MIKLLRMLRCRRWKNSFVVHCQGCLLVEWGFVMQFVHIPCVSVVAL